MDGVQRLQRCCEAVLRNEATVLARLRDQGFACGPGYWEFSLPAVHDWLRRDHPADTPGYRTWRRALYADGAFNTRLRQAGGRILLVTDLGKVDRNLYRLEAVPIETG